MAFSVPPTSSFSSVPSLHKTRLFVLSLSPMFVPSLSWQMSQGRRVLWSEMAPQKRRIFSHRYSSKVPSSTTNIVSICASIPVAPCKNRAKTGENGRKQGLMFEPNVSSHVARVCV